MTTLRPKLYYKDPEMVFQCGMVIGVLLAKGNLRFEELIEYLPMTKKMIRARLYKMQAENIVTVVTEAKLVRKWAIVSRQKKGRA